ncbi:MAG: tetratricopeptide repeat protein [Humidesulfovibrio sp.]|uniref:tetratricopeptide repeat protein n=1 Tax=Humidesulfovibrio sp. TaxID=2910988 RepID=UPI0027E75566|nr:tetratricopeptide repeat protein [Humidesulfovibrio sp.]MDQ7834548.1 tetratricopeptide repeat protein [Humidesulfovibrio sp.]
MRRKIEWYQEVLALEPGSRIFFPLAKLFVEFGQLEDAAKTLRQGLDRHPDTIEARLLLIQVLTKLERIDEARDHLAAVIKPLERYPAFWSLWAQQKAEQDRDFAVFLMLVASHFTGKPIKWTDVVIEGLHSLSDRLIGPLDSGARKPRHHPQPVLPVPPLDEVRPEPPVGESVYEGPAPDAASFRTRTMAELLASQGDYNGALGIYRDLWGRALDEREKTDLSTRIRTLEDGLAKSPEQAGAAKHDPLDDPFGKHAKNRLMSTLEALASRLESRVQARTK